MDFTGRNSLDDDHAPVIGRGMLQEQSSRVGAPHASGHAAAGVSASGAGGRERVSEEDAELAAAIAASLVEGNLSGDSASDCDEGGEDTSMCVDTGGGEEATAQASSQCMVEGAATAMSCEGDAIGNMVGRLPEGGAEGGGAHGEAAFSKFEKLSLPEEPALGCPGSTTVQLKMPDGKACRRRFMADHLVAVVYSFARTCCGERPSQLNNGDDCFTLRTSYPTKVREDLTSPKSPSRTHQDTPIKSPSRTHQDAPIESPSRTH